LKLLKEGIQFTNQVILDLPKFILDGTALNREVSTSIYFAGRRPSTTGESDPYANPKSGALRSVEQLTSSGKLNIFEWHILLVSSTKDSLLDVIRRDGGEIHYISKEAVVFAIPGIGLQALVDEMQGMGGVFVDFGEMELEEGTFLSGTANVMIHFSKR